MGKKHKHDDETAKPAHDLTTDEAMRKLFPLPVRAKAKEVVDEATKRATERS